jgi:hypothetical protein
MEGLRTLPCFCGRRVIDIVKGGRRIYAKKCNSSAFRTSIDALSSRSAICDHGSDTSPVIYRSRSRFP